MLTTLTCALAFSLGAPVIKEPPKKEGPSLLGEWSFVEGTEGGKPVPFKAGELVMKFEEKGVVRIQMKIFNKIEKLDASYTLDTTKAPSAIDLIPPAGENSGTVLGIYKIEKDTLIICTDESGKLRPTEFAAPPGKDDLSLMTFERVAKKDK